MTIDILERLHGWIQHGNTEWPIELPKDLLEAVNRIEQQRAQISILESEATHKDTELMLHESRIAVLEAAAKLTKELHQNILALEGSEGMTDTNDIVTKLRVAADYQGGPKPIEWQAADLLERLQEKVNRLESRGIEDMQQRIAELEAALRLAIITMECNDNFENADICKAALEDKDD